MCCSGGCGGWDRFARGDAVHVTLHAGGCGGWARFAGRDGGDASGAARGWGRCEVCCSVMVMRRVLLCILEVVEGRIGLLEVMEATEVMRCMLLYMLEAVEGGLGLLEAMEMMHLCCFVCWRPWNVSSLRLRCGRCQ